MPGTGRNIGFRVAIGVVLSIGGYLLFEFGRLQANYNIVDAISEKQALHDVISGLEDEIIGLNQELSLIHI